MKFKAVVTGGIKADVEDALTSKEFTGLVIEKIAGEYLGAKDPLNKPAEYYIQEPDHVIQVKDDMFAVEFRLTGVTRNGRTPAQIHKALREMHLLVKKTIQIALIMSSKKVQLFCVIMLDGEIETFLGSGEYSTVIESEAEWISAEN